MKRAAFIDRDGVINRKAPEGRYVTTWDEMDFLPGTAKALRLLNEAGFVVVVVSNQRCIANGLLTLKGVESIHKRMRRRFQALGARIDDIRYCPHAADAGCDCRKPNPGMLMNAARFHNVVLSQSWMIGDSHSDIEAGSNAGCKTAQVNESAPASSQADIVASSLLGATLRILQKRAQSAVSDPLALQRVWGCEIV